MQEDNGYSTGYARIVPDTVWAPVHPQWIPPHDCTPRTVYCPCCGKYIPVGCGWPNTMYTATVALDGNDTMACNHADTA